MTNRFTASARWLRDQHRMGARFVPFAREAGATALPDAYSLQEAHVSAQQSDGLGDIRGWKIGLTSARMQAMCGIDQPVAGAVLDSRLHRSGATIRAAYHGRLGLEFEICLRMGRDLPPRDTPYTAQEVAAAIDAAAAAIEMVDDRNCDYTTLDVESLIADNSWNAGVVLGDWAAVPDDLGASEGIVTLNGAQLDRGFGRDVLGGPLIPLEWLANHLSTRGRGLSKGDLVMTGSLIPTQFPGPGACYDFSVQGIGTVALSIA
ncbi:2-oxo-3-hexenedioate decarboxylase/2-keto-4-pentenoate hydratase [Gemmobacter megaterium]|uniref:2-oxo-3-hexenedioate decarboxylase/2-keto-4-pentenoate hydratase n=1 Tax=Gemmobacter megaterium TaxID=1086013 RepID=A0A1N7NDE9_9RHOB|nr:fumarylacetoacetate hydrolase family protein [Gemmobacter megaterium]GGE14464.1 hydratase [Gemmobacter megaterium]SIS96385.1 2-oxo-3-hexenedioate decarboxylase/2-keto-4-pentenoate hydratase [Gemmobacter megaterium]